MAPGPDLRRGAGTGDGVRLGGRARAQPAAMRVDARRIPRPDGPRVALDRGVASNARGGTRAPGPGDRELPTRAGFSSRGVELPLVADREHARAARSGARVHL